MSSLDKIIESGENFYTEFKQDMEHPDKIAAEIVAFANVEGGMIIFGVDDEGEIYGVEEPDQLEQRLNNILRTNCIPSLTGDIEKKRLNGKTILILHIPKGSDKPYKTSRGVYYERVGTSRREVTREELARLFQQAGMLHYDILLVEDTSLEDLDLTKVREYFRKFVDIDIDRLDVPLSLFLKNAKILGKKEDRFLVTVSGILMFGKQPQDALYQSGISLARYEGTVISERLLHHQHITGTLPELITKANSLVNEYNRTSSIIKGMKRIESKKYPDVVLREAVINAVAHRNYSLSGKRIRIFIFDDRIEVRSPGRLPNTVTLESIKISDSFARNPVLVKYLNNYGFIDDLGRGVPLMIHKMEEIGGEAELEIVGEEFIVTLRAPED